MKQCLSAYTCPHCLYRATCETYQRLRNQLTEGKTTYELLINKPELANEYQGV
jgi:putative component of membrane protein insertase Oxa1/YidC/SpoIIIJ protein YidD